MYYVKLMLNSSNEVTMSAIPLSQAIIYTSLTSTHEETHNSSLQQSIFHESSIQELNPNSNQPHSITNVRSTCYFNTCELTSNSSLLMENICTRLKIQFVIHELVPNSFSCNLFRRPFIVATVVNKECITNSQCSVDLAIILIVS